MCGDFRTATGKPRGANRISLFHGSSAGESALTDSDCSELVYLSFMSRPLVLITGSCGLIGSEVSIFFAHRGFGVAGIDSNHRAIFFGPDGDTRWVLERLRREIPGYRHEDYDIRDRDRVFALVDELRPDLIIHAAAQPSHDRAASIALLDFEVNAL